MRVPRWLKRILRQRTIVILLILFQFAFVGYSIFTNSRVFGIVGYIAGFISLCVALYIIVSGDKPAYKISLTFLILLFPLFGGPFYLLYKGNLVWHRLYKRSKLIRRTTSDNFKLLGSVADEASSNMPEFSTQIGYMDSYMDFCVHKNTDMEYYPSGEAWFASLCEELKKAERYIFLEFFIVHSGKMWDEIEKILAERAANGVDVRLIYDDMGSLKGFTEKKIDTLEKKGIKVSVFNLFVPFISSVQNNRDHRKIVVIDGKVAFTGGANIGDEYINELERFGYWKDNAVRFKGDGAWSFAVMFLQMWSLCENIDEDYQKYLPSNREEAVEDGYVIPYCDSPIEKERLSEQVYKEIINGAREYLYITTPYLIVDDDMVHAITLAAKSGVDVRIITPYKYDKFLVHFTTRSCYKTFIDAGVKIYEFTPGFIHAKTFISDDKRLTVGTVNLDFRSMYLHFECGALVYKNHIVNDAKVDFLKTLEDCHEITPEDCKRNIFVRFMRVVMRIFAPVM